MKLSIFLILILFSNLLLAQQPRLVLPIGHTEAINVSAFNDNGKMFLTASDDNTVKLWETASGSLLLNFTEHKENVKEASFSPDGRLVLSLDNSDVAKLWETSGRMLRDSLGSSKNVYYAAFLPDNKRLLIAGYDTIYISDIGSGKIISNFHTGYQYSYVLSPDGQLLATRYKTTIKIWQVLTGELVKEFGNTNINALHQLYFLASNQGLVLWQPGHPAEVKPLVNNSQVVEKMAVLFKSLGNLQSLTFDREQQNIAVITATSGIRIIDALTVMEKATIPVHKESSFKSLQFSRDAKQLFTARETPDKVGEVLMESWLLKDRQISTKLSTISLSGMYLDIKHFIISSNNRNILFGTSNPKDIFLVDYKAERIVASLGGYSNTYYYADFNPTGDKLITVSSSKPIIWSTKLGKPDTLLSGSITFEGKFSPADGNVLLIDGSSVSLLNTAVPGSRKKIRSNNRNVSIYNGQFSSDGKKVLFWDTENVAVIWDVETGKIFSQSASLGKDFKLGGLSINGEEVVAVSNDSLIFYDSETWEIIRSFNFDWKGDAFYSAEYCTGGDRLIASTFRGRILLIDPVAGIIKDSIAGEGMYHRKVHARPDGKIAIAITKEYKIYLYDLQTKKKIEIAEPHLLDIKSARFSYNSEYFVTASYDNTCKLWNASNGKLISTFFSIDTTDYFTGLPSGYYQASSTASKLLHYVTPELKVISFMQLDVKYHRPDKVLEAIGNTDTALINSYRKAWEKRIKKLDIDTTAFRDGYSVPEADFVNREEIAYEQTNGVLRLHIKGVDSTYKLDRFNVWVNEAPVFGQRGINIKRENSNSFDTTITIKLSQGENRIETSISNVNGTESYRMPLQVNYTPAVKQKETTRFIGIGIDQFSQSQYNLQYSTKDIRDLSLKLKEKYGSDIIIDTLFNENVTVSNVKALKQKLQQTTENDKVIITYSGHGMLSKEYDYYLSTYAVNFDKPEENGLPYDELENLLDSIPARKKLMLIDACHSGEVDKDERLAMDKRADSLGLKRRGVIVTNDQQQRVGLNNSFELMQSLFVNVGKSTGATIISAAAGNQYALEGVNNLPNGIFTYSIIEAMNKYPNMKISELKKIVGERVEQLTNGLQKPTSRNEAIAVDWNIWETKK